MALKTLRNINEIDGFEIKRIVWSQPDDHFIEINDSSNSITFKIQNKPIKEVGVNGCQVDTIIKTARIIISKLNEDFNCGENTRAIENLDEALFWLSERKKMYF